MTTALQPQHPTSTRHTGDNAVSRQQDVLAPAKRSYSLNISRLPAPDQLQIWGFMEFLHEYSTTAWRLVPGADADICVVDGTASTPTLHFRNTLCSEPQDTVPLARPLQIEAFVATLLQLEAPHPARLCGRVTPLIFLNKTGSCAHWTGVSSSLF